MFKLTIKELAAHKLRLLTTAFAVLLGVAFMAGTLVFTDTISATFDSALADADEGVDAYVRSAVRDRPRLRRARPASRRLTRRARRLGRRCRRGRAAHQRLRPAGRPRRRHRRRPQQEPGVRHELGDGRRPEPVRAGRAATRPPTTTRSSSTRRAPTRPATCRATSRPCSPRANRASSRSPASPRSAPPTPLPGRRRCCSPMPSASELLASPGEADAIAVTADAGVSQADVAAAVQAAVGSNVEVITGATLVDQNQAALAADFAGFGTIMLIFAFVAVFVGAFIINNTFSITVAQRTREMAMLRAIGASGRQVKRSVLIEAVAIGALASAAGLVAGIGVASGLRQLMSVFGFDMPDGPTVISPNAMIISFAVGVIVTVLSAWLPARRAAKIAPIAALRDVSVDRSGGSKRRAVVGTVITAGGVGALLAGLVRSRSRWSVSVRWRRSSVCRCSVRCSPVRSPGCSVCRCGCVGSVVSSPPATRCAIRSGPLARRRR